MPKIKRILVTNAGGSPSLNFINSLHLSGEKFYIIGIDANKYSLERGVNIDRKFLVPYYNDPNYLPILKSIIKETKPDMIHVQNDYELGVVSINRDNINVKNFFPSKKTIRICQDKFQTYEAWSKAGLPQPKTIIIANKEDLKKAFDKFGSPLWLREIHGGAGKGSIMAKDIDMAISWINFSKGWGIFTAAEYLSPQSITWQSIWRDGELIIAQNRKRLYWEFANRAPSGITGLTGTGVTVKDRSLDKMAIRAIKAVDNKPHGIFSVDMTYDKKGVLNPTEINIGRFFTTHEFFSQAGLNMPYIYVKLAFNEPVKINKKLNPLKPGLAWVRGLDFLPKLTTISAINSHEDKLKKRLSRIK